MIALTALAVRLTYIWFWRRGLPVGGDSRYYHEGANLLAHGHGFVQPFVFLDAGKSIAAADHPPLYLVYLAGFSLVGLSSATAHMVVSAVAGAATVVVVALVGREIAGPRAGLLAAILAALNANFWAYDGGLESETIAQLAVAITLYATYRWWKTPSPRRAVAVGAGIGMAALARAELAALIILLLVPLVVWRSALARRDRVRHGALATAALLVVVGPWCVYNLTRFHEPTLLSNGFGFTLDSAACDDGFYGPNTGYWSRACVVDTEARAGVTDGTDRSVVDRIHRDHALDYISGHLSRLPVVTLARLGRETGLWHPRVQVQLDSFVGGRELWVAWSSMVWFWCTAILAVPGAVLLRRRRVPVFPLLSLVVLAVVTTAVFFALFRYRAAAEVALVLLAGVTLDAVAARRRVPSASMAAS